MGAHYVGLWLYTLITMLPFGLWSIYMLKKEKWIFSKEKNSGLMGFFIVGGVAYQVLLPMYWSFILSPQGL